MVLKHRPRKTCWHNRELTQHFLEQLRTQAQLSLSKLTHEAWFLSGQTWQGKCWHTSIATHSSTWGHQVFVSFGSAQACQIPPGSPRKYSSLPAQHSGLQKGLFTQVLPIPTPHNAQLAVCSTSVPTVLSLGSHLSLTAILYRGTDRGWDGVKWSDFLPYWASTAQDWPLHLKERCPNKENWFRI